MFNYSTSGDLFKPHILESVPYKGGITREAINPVAYKLSSNENMFGPSPKAIAAIGEYLASVNEYSFENDLLLRQELANHSDQMLTADQFVTGNSGMELLDMLIRGFISPGNEVILSSPTFMAYQNVALLGGAKVLDVPLIQPGYKLDVESILNNVSDKTKLIFISNPNNPTGSIVTRTEMDLLMKRLPEHVLVVYDEVYHHYVESSDYARAVDYIHQGRNIVGLHSFSKAYGLAGLRIGYAFSTPRIAGYLQRVRRPFMINTLSMVAAIAALKDKDHIAATRVANSTGKRYLYQQLNEISEVIYYPTNANFILIRPSIDPGIFVARMLERGVMVRDAAAMNAQGMIRVTIGNQKANEVFVGILRDRAFWQNCCRIN